MSERLIADKYLTFEGDSKSYLSGETAELLIDTFEKVYPAICDFFNNGELLNVVYKIDPEYNGVAMVGGGKITLNPEWMKTHPMDIDCMTHELIHIAQNYRNVACPLWICEGLADYGRAKFGLYNKESGWSMPKYNEKQNYTDGYRVSAAFLTWIEENVDASLPKELNSIVRQDKYTDNYFFEKTGKTVDDLWQMYAASGN